MANLNFFTAKPDFFTAKRLKFLHAMPCAHAPQAPKIAAAEKTMAVDEESEDKLDDENLTMYYYYKGFQYKEICMFLQNTWAAQESQNIEKARYHLSCHSLPSLSLSPPFL